MQNARRAADNEIDMALDVTLLERLPDPVLLVQPTGETLYANRAWHELASRLGIEPNLAALFGAGIRPLLDEASRDGRASSTLPVAIGHETTRGFRVTVRGDAEEATLAVQLADLSEEVAWRHRMFLRNNELAVLSDIGTALAGTLEFDALAPRIWEQCGRIMDHANGFIALQDRDRSALTFPVWSEDGARLPAGECRPFGRALAEHVVATRRPLLLNGDVAAQLDTLGLASPARPCASLMATPILSEGLAVGALVLTHPADAEHFGRHELGILNIMATQAGSAIRTAWMFEAMRMAYDELSGTQSRLLESERLRGVTEAVGTLNHEVNNPLATIVGTAQLLLRDPALPAPARTRIERMLDAARRIQWVTNRMATLIQATSRPYPGQMQILDVLRSVATDELPAVAAPQQPLEDAMRAIWDSLPGGGPAPGAGSSDSSAA